MAGSISIRALTEDDRQVVADFCRLHWGEDRVIAHGDVFTPSALPGLAAYQGQELVGLLTYTIGVDQCEIVTLDAVYKHQGIGRKLIHSLLQCDTVAGCRRIWLITTNDNLDALWFYQRSGFRLCALRPGAVDQSRRIKPSIPEVGEYGIPLRDELELEIVLEKQSILHEPLS